ncbi:MAG: hypothetical protein LBK97_02155 [Prevotellaceae bacterium]|nr:hypothetical protein [Prevotellaceae bacterium]
MKDVVIRPMSAYSYAPGLLADTPEDWIWIRQKYWIWIRQKHWIWVRQKHWIWVRQKHWIWVRQKYWIWIRQKSGYGYARRLDMDTPEVCRDMQCQYIYRHKKACPHT